jgi:hypothetical protein
VGGYQPVVRPLRTQDNTKRTNADTHASLAWNSCLKYQYFSWRRHSVPYSYTSRPQWSAHPLFQSKYSLQHPVLKDTESMLVSQKTVSRPHKQINHRSMMGEQRHLKVDEVFNTFFYVLIIWLSIKQVRINEDARESPAIATNNIINILLLWVSRMLNNKNKHYASSVKTRFIMIFLFHKLTVQGEQRPHSLSERLFNKRSRI